MKYDFESHKNEKIGVLMNYVKLFTSNKKDVNVTVEPTIVDPINLSNDKPNEL